MGKVKQCRQMDKIQKTMPHDNFFVCVLILNSLTSPIFWILFISLAWNASLRSEFLTIGKASSKTCHCPFYKEKITESLSLCPTLTLCYLHCLTSKHKSEPPKGLQQLYFSERDIQLSFYQSPKDSMQWNEIVHASYTYVMYIENNFVL